MPYIENGRVVFGSDNRTAPVNAPPPAPAPVSSPAPAPSSGYSYSGSSNSSGFSALGSTPTSTPTPTSAPSMISSGISGNVGSTPLGSGIISNAISSGNTPTPAPAPAPKTPTTTTAPTSPTITMREVAEKIGLPISYVNGQLMIGQQVVDTSKLQNIDGRWTGSINDVAGLFGYQQLRSGLESTGRSVDYNPTTGQISVNGIIVDPSQYSMMNLGGNNYVKPETLQQIINATGGTKPIGQELNKQGITTDQQKGQVSDQTQQTSTDFYRQQYDLLSKDLSDTRKMLQDYIGKNTTQDTINSILGEMKNYQGTFTTQITDLISKSLQPFNYNPAEDKMLDKAIKYADASMMAEMNRRGILNSSITEGRMEQIRTDLMPQYQQLAMQSYNEQIDRQFKTAQFMNQINQQDFDRFSTYANAAINQLEKVDEKTLKSFEKVIDTIVSQIQTNTTMQKNEIDAEDKKVQRALDKIKTLGYVDNESSIITGLPVGTPSFEAQKLLVDRMDKYNIESVKATNDLKKAKYDSDLKKEELAAAAAPKINLGKIEGELSKYSATEALAYITNPENSQQVIELLGAEYSTLIKNLSARQQKEIDDQRADAKFTYTQQQDERRFQTSRSDKERQFQISERKADERADKAAANEAKQDYKSYANAVKQTAKGILNDYEGEIADDVAYTAVSGKDKDGKDITQDFNKIDFYRNNPGSTQRKDGFDRVRNYLNETDMTGEDIVQSYNELGFTKDEIKTWLGGD